MHTDVATSFISNCKKWSDRLMRWNNQTNDKGGNKDAQRQILSNFMFKTFGYLV
jgi:hypothetical protein